MDQKHQVVIIGGGFGGLYAARALRHAPVQITLLDRRNFHLFQPLLYQVATGALSPGNIAVPLRYVLKRLRNVKVLLGEALDIDPAGKRVILKDGEMVYDTLVVSAGSQNNYFGHSDWPLHAPGLKSIEEATEMRRRILLAFETAERESDPKKRQAWLTFIVIGGGPTGVELAGALGEIARDTLRHEFRAIDTEKARIFLIDAVDRILPTYVPELSAQAVRSLEELGVTVRTKTFVTGLAADHLLVKTNNHDEQIPARTILWAAGVQPVPLTAALAKATGQPIQKGGRILVEPNLTIPGYPDIYVIGDMAQVMDAASGKPLPGVAPVAIQEGRYVAKHIAARLAGKTIEPFVYHSHGDMATIGRAAAVADLGWVRFHGLLAWLAWLFIHLLFLVDVEDRLLVFTQWAWNYLTRNRGARLITGNTPDQIQPRL